MPSEHDRALPSYREPRRAGGMDPGTKRLAIFAGAVGGGLLLIAGGWAVMGGHGSTTVPVVQADSRPIRVKPDNPGGMQVIGANEEIMSGGSDTGTVKMAPPPEAPQVQELKALEAARKKRLATAAAPPPPPPAPAHQAAPEPAAKPMQAAANPPVPPAPPAPRAAKPAVAPQPARAESGNSAQVQLAAVKSEEAAKQEWERLTRKMPDLFGRLRPEYERAEHDGKTFWRLRAGGFSTIAAATQFCERVRSKGGGCSIANF